MPSPRHLISYPTATAPRPNHAPVDGWRLRAACFQHPTLKPETWDDSLPVDGREPLRAARIKAAIAVCDGCPVKDTCLAGALARGEKEGVWGGSDLRYRKRTSVKTDPERRERDRAYRRSKAPCRACGAVLSRGNLPRHRRFVHGGEAA